jgi:hypothetical protein
MRVLDKCMKGIKERENEGAEGRSREIHYSSLNFRGLATIPMSERMLI